MAIDEPPLAIDEKKNLKNVLRLKTRISFGYILLIVVPAWKDKINPCVDREMIISTHFSKVKSIILTTNFDSTAASFEIITGSISSMLVEYGTFDCLIVFPEFVLAKFSAKLHVIFNFFSAFERDVPHE